MAYEESISASTTDEDKIKKINDCLKRGKMHLIDWRIEAQEAYDYYAGNQWSEDDKRKLQDQQRPTIVFNRLARTINAVTGLEVQNRQEVDYLPREKDDNVKTEIYKSAAKWTRDQCNAEDEESQAFTDALICGMGWTDTYLSYEEDLDGIPVEDRVDPLQMLYDPNARKRNLTDARWIARAKEFTYEDYKETYPDAEPEYGPFWLDLDSQVVDTTANTRYLNTQIDQEDKQRVIYVIQYQYWEREFIYRVFFPDGRTEELSDAAYKKISTNIKESGLRVIKQPKKVFKQCFVNGTQILEEGDLPGNRFSLNCITGLQDRNNNVWFGLVRLMRDPQMWYNKWLSQILHIINSNAKGGLLAEMGAFNNPGKVQDEWAKPDPVILLNPGGLAKIQQREAPRYPEGIDRLLQYAMQNISDTPGVNLELMGVANRDQPGVLEMTRKEAGVTILATFFDSLRLFRKNQGRLLAELIREYIADGRLIRIVGEEGAQFVPLIKDQMALRYDIIVDDAPTSPHMKEKVFSVFTALMPTLLQGGIPIPPDILDYAPLPESLVQKWKAMLSNDKQRALEDQLKQITLMQRQLETEGLALANKESQTRSILNVAKAQKETAVAEDEEAQAMRKHELESVSEGRKTQQMVHDENRKDLAFMLDQRRKNIQAEMDVRRKSKPQMMQ